MPQIPPIKFLFSWGTGAKQEEGLTVSQTTDSESITCSQTPLLSVLEMAMRKAKRWKKCFKLLDNYFWKPSERCTHSQAHFYDSIKETGEIKLKNWTFSKVPESRWIETLAPSRLIRRAAMPLTLEPLPPKFPRNLRKLEKKPQYLEQKLSFRSPPAQNPLAYKNPVPVTAPAPPMSTNQDPYQLKFNPGRANSEKKQN